MDAAVVAERAERFRLHALVDARRRHVEETRTTMTVTANAATTTTTTTTTWSSSSGQRMRPLPPPDVDHAHSVRSPLPTALAVVVRDGNVSLLPSPLSRLPDELWLAVFEQPSMRDDDAASAAAAATCRTFRTLVATARRTLAPSSSTTTTSSLSSLSSSLSLSSSPPRLSLVHASHRYRSLQHVDLTRCAAAAVDEFTLYALCVHVGSSLRSLVAPRCAAMTVRTAEYIGAACVRLERLDVSWCRALHGARVVPALLDGAACVRARLRVLSLEGCSALTSANFAALGASAALPELRELNLSWLPWLSDEALIAVVERAPRLRQLTTRHCDKLSDAGASWLLEHLRGATVSLTDTLVVGGETLYHNHGA